MEKEVKEFSICGRCQEVRSVTHYTIHTTHMTHYTLHTWHTTYTHMTSSAFVGGDRKAGQWHTMHDTLHTTLHTTYTLLTHYSYTSTNPLKGFFILNPCYFCTMVQKVKMKTGYHHFECFWIDNEHDNFCGFISLLSLI